LIDFSALLADYAKNLLSRSELNPAKSSGQRTALDHFWLD